MCVYRDMDPSRPGIGCSVTYDDGQSWHYVAALYESPGAYSGWASACGYPAVVRLADEQISLDVVCWKTTIVQWLEKEFDRLEEVGIRIDN